MVDLGLNALRERLARVPLPIEAAAEAEAELARLGDLPGAGRPGATAWLDAVLGLPWLVPARPPFDVRAARDVLERGMEGQPEAKERVLEALAAGALRPDGRVPALCLLGPPGVGKSHLIESMGAALGRPVAHVRLTSADPVAALWGVPRHAGGTGPGRVLEAVRAAGVPDPVLVLYGLDEVLAEDEGDATAALLALLDPQARAGFRDRWLGLDYDLSRAVVLTTAHVPEVLPLEVRDRLVFATLRGYTDDEKRAIARTHLLPRLTAEAGLGPADVVVPDAVLDALLTQWTFEPGLHALGRRLLALLRAVALRKALGDPPPFEVSLADLPRVLGPRVHLRDRVARTCVPGVAMGLAWTPAGGQVLFIEASAVPGRGNLKLTGSLGDVMKESAEAATTWLREYAPGLGDVLQMDLHVHVPEGGVPKDGPSAGIALLLAIASAVSGRVVRHDLAATGEITLRGQVLRVGGIREKVMAAQQAGVKALILPRRNEEDLAEVPPEILAQMDLHLVERVEEALGPALASNDGCPLPEVAAASPAARRAGRGSRARTAAGRPKARRPRRGRR